jgi:hypothetical protein
MRVAFPKMDDENSLLALAAILVVVCTVDDILEILEPEMASKCAHECATILSQRYLDEESCKSTQTDVTYVRVIN